MYNLSPTSSPKPLNLKVYHKKATAVSGLRANLLRMAGAVKTLLARVLYRKRDFASVADERRFRASIPKNDRISNLRMPPL